MDRETGNVPQSQLGFIRVLLRPLVQAWVDGAGALGWHRGSSAPAEHSAVCEDERRLGTAGAAAQASKVHGLCVSTIPRN